MLKISNVMRCRRSRYSLESNEVRERRMSRGLSNEVRERRMSRGFDPMCQKNSFFDFSYLDSET
jgi:hypothetical protein